ncbi:hypothetical protein GGU11DRAFT_750433 [Lentinula aff. detonsa]|nr:hypothetical protein GGU11DRAFT_750433 [Lentinula aff. detonsa]
MRDILDKAYGFQSSAGSSNSSEDDHSVSVLLETGKSSRNSDGKVLSTPPPIELTRILGGSRNIRCFTQVPAFRGFFNTPSGIAQGNSYIAYKPHGDFNADWVAGRIQYIFELDGKKKFAVRRSKPSFPTSGDPFARFRQFGFEAKSVSPLFVDELEVIDDKWAVGHTARWDLNEGLTVAVNLGRESYCCKFSNTYAL